MPTVRLLAANQGDRAAAPREGWDVACLTERSKSPAPNWAERYAPGIKGLAIDWNPDVLDVTGKRRSLVHAGAAKITPGRGTIWVTGRLTNTRIKVAVVCSHRLNDPSGSRRPGGSWRRLLWGAHAMYDRALFVRLERRGYRVLYGGDINDRTADLLPLHRLLKGRYDAIGYSRKGVTHKGTRTENGAPSDHARFIATFEIKEK